MKIIIFILLTLNTYSLERYAIKYNPSQVIEFASGEIGVKEIGKNRGLRVDTYNRSVGNPLGSPYCMAGIYFCFNQFENPLIKSGLAQSQIKYFKKIGFKTPYKAKIGDLLTWRTNQTFGHIEIIVKVLNGGWVQTIGFNTTKGNGNQRDGGGVYLRKRHLYNRLGILHIKGIAGFE